MSIFFYCRGLIYQAHLMSFEQGLDSSSPHFFFLMCKMGIGYFFDKKMANS